MGEREEIGARTGPGEGQAIYVYPGQVVTSAKGDSLTTVLGTCISVCLFDSGSRIGGMTHFLLPLPEGDAAASTRFAAPAIEGLVRAMVRLGADRSRLVAKVFGGCVPGVASGNGFHVGSRNAEAARAVLARAKIPVVVEDVGGQNGRRVVFDTGDGSARVRTFGRLV